MNVLFLCTGNSCRSQMAEAFGRRYAAKGHRVFSAGTDPHGINPRTVEAMAEAGINLDDHRSKNVDEIPVADLDLVVTLCGDADESCPAGLAGIERVHWPLPDPARAQGTDEEISEAFRRVRDEIRERVADLLG